MKKQKSKFKIDLQIATNYKNLPSKKMFCKWVQTALAKYPKTAEICLRIVNNKEIKLLNSHYRHHDKTTNVLAFTFTQLPGVKTHALGDVVLSAPYINQEARRLQLPANLHWAHITIHGVLHLLGYDHRTTKQAIIMEKKEMELLQSCGFDSSSIFNK
jgi:probable rRNA maturation factor